MKNLILIILIVVFGKAVKCQDTVQNPPLHIVWFWQYSNPKKQIGFLYETKDSSLVISDLKLRKVEDYRAYKMNTEVYFNDIRILKVRKRRNSILWLFAGGLASATLGVLYGYGKGDDPPCDGFLCVRFLKEDKAGLYGAALGLFGLGIGGVGWKARIKFPIKGKSENFNKYQKMLRSRSVVN